MQEEMEILAWGTSFNCDFASGLCGSWLLKFAVVINMAHFGDDLPLKII